MIDLKSRLFQAARNWCAAQGDDVPLSRIGKRVAGDANFFLRLEAPEATLQVATLEKFGRFLTDAANWPDEQVPYDICEFAHAIGISSDACVVYSGQPDEMSGAQVDETRR